MWRAKAAFVASIFAVLAPDAFAADAMQLYAQGAFAEAIAEAESEGSAEGFEYAARASLADAELRDAPCLACLEHAEELARETIARDPTRPGGYVMLVAALGRKARLLGWIAAQRQGIATETGEALTRALAIDPDYALALSARGAWHIEIAHQAGGFLASLLYGADAGEGKSYFERAMAAEPGNLVIPYQFALALTAYDMDGERDRIEELLAEARTDMPRDAYERAIVLRAAELENLLEAGRDEVFVARAEIFRGEM